MMNMMMISMCPMRLWVSIAQQSASSPPTSHDKPLKKIEGRFKSCLCTVGKQLSEDANVIHCSMVWMHVISQLCWQSVVSHNFLDRRLPRNFMHTALSYTEKTLNNKWHCNSVHVCLELRHTVFSGPLIHSWGLPEVAHLIPTCVS